MNLKINESQNIEFKRLYKDEYIKWISAFGNSEGVSFILVWMMMVRLSV